MHDVYRAIIHVFAQDPLSSALGGIIIVTGLAFIRLLVDRR